ncbi:hypothetical protein COCSUDRAFT_56712 [Coccomyxa subellipsoidea C-169]|uniref:Uncharacterized protein n=1 Tax=Coccomyxa subellipsoidea (strain C-169) TaxID=574566 RepID=I0YSX9_COCSC|nr:hypothetical protein COCSUDRAFT_56712 [Coccomyxa subellipsoidea C-169]EIE21498.1 hypothetical protein COCSUDRAFT_56712 [Coccomyxa subellipsoidea C-169]|eukprot:XP_005646042.1 hypothetical protein COCSUDRAFT_56712 [Coccomyxa subellipsoidea C-169]
MPARSKRCERSARVDAPFFDAECRQLKRDLRARARRGGDPTELRALERLYHNTKLQNGRATGVHGLPAELFRYAKNEKEPGMPPPENILGPALVAVLNSAFVAGQAGHESAL